MMADWRENARLIPDLEFVRQHVGAAGDYVAEQYRRATTERLYRFPVESPIEAVFYAWWLALLNTGEISEEGFALERQCAVEACGWQYRVDFAIKPARHLEEQANQCGVAIPKIAIELDGHEFHERTREQVELRNQRDRDLQASGWVVLHFAGSEVHRAPRQCVLGAYGTAYIMYWRLEDQITNVQLDEVFGPKKPTGHEG